MESKSNQSALPTAAMTTAPTASKPAVMVEKKMRRGFKSYAGERFGVNKPKEL